MGTYNNIKVCVTTSNSYLHLIPVFCYFFNRYWNAEQEVTILGYSQPKCELPANFKFVSMGVQGPVTEWSTDKRKYFESIEDDWFILMMEDAFVRRADVDMITNTYKYLQDNWNSVGRCDLTKDIQNRPHVVVDNSVVVRAKQDTNYRVSLQPSIWYRPYLLKYLTPGLSPWAMEKQEARNDGWNIIGLLHPPLRVNEGVRKDNIHKLDLNGFPEQDVKHIKSLL